MATMADNNAALKSLFLYVIIITISVPEPGVVLFYDVITCVIIKLIL